MRSILVFGFSVRTFFPIDITSFLSMCVCVSLNDVCWNCMDFPINFCCCLEFSLSAFVAYRFCLEYNIVLPPPKQRRRKKSSKNVVRQRRISLNDYYLSRTVWRLCLYAKAMLSLLRFHMEIRMRIGKLSKQANVIESQCIWRCCVVLFDCVHICCMWSRFPTVFTQYLVSWFKFILFFVFSLCSIHSQLNKPMWAMSE